MKITDLESMLQEQLEEQLGQGTTGGGGMNKHHVVTISFGRGGHSVKGWMDSGSFDLSGYEDPDSFVKEGLEPEYVLPKEGVPVVDMRAAVETREGFNYAIRGPLCCRKGTPQVCPEPSAMLMSGLQGSFATYAALQVTHKGPEPGPLDEVSVDDWVAGWKAHGARVGRYDGQGITWET